MAAEPHEFSAVAVGPGQGDLVEREHVDHGLVGWRRQVGAGGPTASASPPVLVALLEDTDAGQL